MITRDIHYGMPTVDTALYQLDLAIKAAKNSKDKLLEVIVGHGSTGGTHKIKTATVNKLDEYKDKKIIKDYIIGNEIDIFNIKYQNFMGKEYIPESEKIKRNKGSIFIYL